MLSATGSRTLLPDPETAGAVGISRKVTIVNRKGLHARPAAEFVKLASRFKSKIRVKNADKDIDGKSIMGVMMLAAAKDSQIEIFAEGDDELNAIESLADLVSRGFEE